MNNLNNLIGFIDDVNNVGRRRPQQYKDRPNYYNILGDDEFIYRFRLSKNCVDYLLTLLAGKLETATDRNMALAPMNQVLLTLRFYALGTMLISVADMFGVSVSSASRTIKNVSYAIAGLSGLFLKIPTNDLVETKMKMFKIARFPLVFGAIDCTHVRIQSPGGEFAESFRNRKGWPGSAHDSNIFRNSRLYARLESGEFNNNAILGDSGYALKPYMLTPILNPVGRIEMLYNESQIRTRNIIERCFGVWKRRFPVLSLGMRLQLKTVQVIIVATAILHNICRDMNEDLPEDSSDDVLHQLNEAEDMAETDHRHDDNGEDSITRNSLLNNYFARL